MQKELWFEPSYIPFLKSGTLRRTFREKPDERKNNDYASGDTVRCRIHYDDGGFGLEEFQLRISDVWIRQIGQLAPEDFEGSDADSRIHLKQKLKGHYGRPYTDADTVRVIDFEYTR